MLLKFPGGVHRGGTEDDRNPSRAAIHGHESQEDPLLVGLLPHVVEGDRIGSQRNDGVEIPVPGEVRPDPEAFLLENLLLEREDVRRVVDTEDMEVLAVSMHGEPFQRVQPDRADPA